MDLAEILAGLASKPRSELLKLIGEMALVAPESLSACSVKDFDPDAADDEFD